MKNAHELLHVHHKGARNNDALRFCIIACCNNTAGEKLSLLEVIALGFTYRSGYHR
jgi:hypothetical protein